MRSVSYRSATEIDVTFTENVTGGTAGFFLNSGFRTIYMEPGDIMGNATTLRTSGDAITPNRWFFNYAEEQGNVTDSESHALAGFSDVILLGTDPDNILPSILNATATAGNRIEVVFSEPVRHAGTDNGTWSVVGRDSDGLAVLSATDPGGSDTITLTLSGDFPIPRRMRSCGI